MKQLVTNHGVVLIQEHWLFESHLSKLKCTGVNVDVGKSSMDENIPLHDRPYGGCAIVQKTNIKGKIATVMCIHQRLCEVCFNN